MAEQNYTIDLEVINTFQKQNPTGYFHLLYLVAEHRILKRDNDIKVLREDIENLDQQRISEINEAQTKLRDQIKSSTKRYEKMLEKYKQEITEIKKELKTEKAKKTVTGVNEGKVWKNKYDELAKQMEVLNGKN